MKMIAPYTGIVVEVQEKSVARMKASGFVPADKKHSRPTKAELLEEVGKQKTNPELAELAGMKPKKPKKKKSK